MQATGLVRLSWIIVALFALLLMATAAPYRYALLASSSSGYSSAAQDLGLSLPVLAFVITTLEVTTWLSFIVVAGVIAWHKSNHWFPLVIAVTLTFLGIMPPLVDGLMTVHIAWQTLIPLLRALVYSGMLAMLCLFPDGRFVPSWSRWYLFAWFLFALIFWPYISTVLSEMSMIPDTPTLPNGLVLLVIGVLATIGLLFQFIRYRTYASAEQRQQTKWYLFGLLLLNTSSLVNGLSLSLFPALRDAAFGSFLYTLGIETLLMLAGIGFSVAVAFAILRYRLWDIDVLINRTLVYGTLTAGTMGVYVLMVGGFGALLPAQQGQTAAFILATGLVLVIIRPLHTQLQTAANRLVPIMALSNNSIIVEEENLTVSKNHFQIPQKVIRSIWVLVGLGALILIVAAVPYRFTMLTTDVYGYGTAVSDRGLSYNGFAAYFTGLETIIGIAFLVLATFIAWQKTGDWLALMVAVTLAYMGILLPLADGLIYANEGWYWPIVTIRILVYTGFIAMLCLFPDGRFRPQWSRWLLLAWIAFIPAGWQRVGETFSDMAVIPNARTFQDGLVLLLLSGWIGTGIVMQLIRYKKFASPEQRQQTKWVFYGLFLVSIVGFANAAFLTIFPSLRENAANNLVYVLVGGTIILLAVLSLAAMIAIAVFRYRLWDIDSLINRTLVYGTLTVGTVGIYVLVVGGVGTLLQNEGSAAIAFVAAGVVAVLFQPLRLRLQTAVNRLMYGQRDDPVGMLTHLAQQLEAVDRLESILPILVETIATALKLPHVSLWLPESEVQWEPVAVFGPQTDDLHMIPLLYQNREIGRLFVASRGPGERFSREDERLLAAVAQLSATTVQAAQLTFELQQSRRQIVTSREEERRRLRRDLHDGLGPVLASVALQADTARDLADSDPAETKAILNSIMDQAQTAVADVRRLVYDLRPPALDELGLVGALRQLAQTVQHQLSITIDTQGPLPPLPAAVEVAAYRIAQEAMHNVVKHAQASRCTVTIGVDDGLLLVIADNGVGIKETAVTGVGLISMKERAAELGGHCTIQCQPVGGAIVRAVLPLPPEEQT